MRTRIATLVLGVGLAFSLLILLPRVASYHLPGNQQGYEPVQPIAFSHRLHAGDLQISCQYCHSGVERSRNAGFPPANLCMNCHKTHALVAIDNEAKKAEKDNRKPREVVAPELRKLFDALALDDKLLPDAKKKPQPLRWVRVHNLPDFACFDHRAHVGAGVDCQQCHGSVETMERIRQVQDLSMGWCVNCHREANQKGVKGRKVHASIDCAACHY